MISHSDLTKSVVESDPPRGVAVAMRLASIFIFLYFLCGASGITVFCRRGFVDEAARERGHRADEMQVRDY
jgi:hypothetical protein